MKISYDEFPANHTDGRSIPHFKNCKTFRVGIGNGMEIAICALEIYRYPVTWAANYPNNNKIDHFSNGVCANSYRPVETTCLLHMRTKVIINFVRSCGNFIGKQQHTEPLNHLNECQMFRLDVQSMCWCMRLSISVSEWVSQRMGNEKNIVWLTEQFSSSTYNDSSACQSVPYFVHALMHPCTKPQLIRQSFDW